MFLDEKLEKIYAETEGNEIERSNRFVKALTDRLQENFDPQGTVQNFLTGLKQIDNSWQLFAKRHGEIDPMAFRTLVKKCDPDGNFAKVLNW